MGLSMSWDLFWSKIPTAVPFVQNNLAETQGSHPARDMERSHKALVRKPGPTGGSRPEADEDAPGQGGPTTRGQRAMLPAGAVPELAFRIRQGAVGGVSRPVPRDDEPSRREDGEGCLRARPRNAFPTCVEIPRVLPKEDQLKGNPVLLGTHNQQRRIYYGKVHSACEVSPKGAVWVVCGS